MSHSPPSEAILEENALVPVFPASALEEGAFPMKDEAADPALDDADPVRLGDTVKRLREEAGWSIQRLAREAGVSSATIFKIEKDRMVPSVTVLLKLARALKQPIASLLENPAPKERTGYAVFKKGDHQEFRFAELPLTIQRTVGQWKDRQLEAGFYVVDEGGTPARAPLSHPGEKLYFVLQGRVRFEVDGEYTLLEPGDVLHLKATIPHRWENAAEGPSRMFFVVTPVPAFARDAGKVVLPGGDAE
jgi:transcriptional regulator with XRE-family HTH domain